MKYRTAIISTEFMDTRVKEAVLPFEEHCTFTTYYYKKSSEIPEIYKSIEDKYDGFIVNGIISRAMLRAACPDTKKPIETFHVDMLAYYQELFRLMTLKPDLKAERLYADFMMGKKYQGSCGERHAGCGGRELLQSGGTYESGGVKRTPL